MKKFLFVTAFIMPVLTQAQETSLKKEYKPQFGLSLIAGVQNHTNFESSAPIYGIEFSMECPIIQTRKSLIRQQISLLRQDGIKYKSLSAEINPQYKLLSGRVFEWGVGPSVGVIFNNATEHRKLFSYGVGTSVIWQFKKFNIGLASRYALTKKVSFEDLNKESTRSVNLNNLRSIFKFGYKLSK